MRGNSLLTTVHLEAPEYVQTCFVSSIPELIKGRDETFRIFKAFNTPHKDIFFKQKLSSFSSISVSFEAKGYMSEPELASVYILKGEDEYRRLTLGLVNSPVASIYNVSSGEINDFKLRFEGSDDFYFLTETYNNNTRLSLKLTIGYLKYDIENDTVCTNGTMDHEYSAGEVMIITNTKNIYSRIELNYKGKFVIMN